MRVSNGSDLHLSYCTNIHPGEAWPDVFAQLQGNLPDLKGRMAPGQAFGVGLRLSAAAARTLLDRAVMEGFRDWLGREGLYVFTINGFPYGNFHGVRVKDRVYQPDWRSEARVAYTQDLANVMAGLLKEGEEGSISTSPVAYKGWFPDESTRRDVFGQSCCNLAETALYMDRLKDRCGVLLHLDIEPEPDCLIENTDETVGFFNNWLLTDGVRFLKKTHGLRASRAEEIIREHLCVCYDTCHFAVEYEEPQEALGRFASEGIRIGKMQVSAALKVVLPEVGQRTKIRERLQEFADDTYLHQVIERRDDGSLHRYPDLPEALDHIASSNAREWRIHFHVPVFLEHFEELQSTQDAIVRSLEYLRVHQCCQHVEVETYTWDVLPPALKTDLLSSIARELTWTRAELQRSNGPTLCGKDPLLNDQTTES